MQFISHFVIMLWLLKDFALFLVHQCYNQITTPQSTSSLPNTSHFRHHCFLDIDNWNFTCSFCGVCCHLSFAFCFRSCWFRLVFGIFTNLANISRNKHSIILLLHENRIVLCKLNDYYTCTLTYLDKFCLLSTRRVIELTGSKIIISRCLLRKFVPVTCYLSKSYC